jgi:hypothetical protein
MKTAPLSGLKESTVKTHTTTVTKEVYEMALVIAVQNSGKPIGETEFTCDIDDEDFGAFVAKNSTGYDASNTDVEKKKEMERAHGIFERMIEAVAKHLHKKQASEQKEREKKANAAKATAAMIEASVGGGKGKGNKRKEEDDEDDVADDDEDDDDDEEEEVVSKTTKKGKKKAKKARKTKGPQTSGDRYGGGYGGGGGGSSTTSILEYLAKKDGGGKNEKMLELENENLKLMIELEKLKKA